MRSRRARYLSNLGNSLRTRFGYAGDRADLDLAIDFGQQAVDAAAPGRPDRAGYLANVAAALFRRFELAGDRADLDAAIGLGWQVARAVPPGHYGHDRCSLSPATGGILGSHSVPFDRSLHTWRDSPSNRSIVAMDRCGCRGPTGVVRLVGRHGGFRWRGGGLWRRGWGLVFRGG